MEIKQLAVIEEVLEANVYADDWETKRNNALTALSSLKAMLEEEGDIDEIVNFFDFLANADVVTWNGGKGLLDFHHSYQQAQLKRFKSALSRLALRAKLNEAKLVEAKREVLTLISKCPDCAGSGIFTDTGFDSAGYAIPVPTQCTRCYNSGYDPNKVKEFIDQQLAALKEEEHGKD